MVLRVNKTRIKIQGTLPTRDSLWIWRYDSFSRSKNIEILSWLKILKLMKDLKSSHQWLWREGCSEMAEIRRPLYSVNFPCFFFWLFFRSRSWGLYIPSKVGLSSNYTDVGHRITTLFIKIAWFSSILFSFVHFKSKYASGLCMPTELLSFAHETVRLASCYWCQHNTEIVKAHSRRLGPAKSMNIMKLVQFPPRRPT